MNKYVLNYVHLFLYVVCFIGSYYTAYVYHFFSIPCSIVLGWCLYAFVTVGHDCMHQNFSPYPMLNRILATIFLNGILMPSYVWQDEHSSHHADPGNPHDTMLLDGATFFMQFVNLLKSQKPLSTMENVAKVPLLVALLFLPLYCLPVVWITMIFSFMILSLTPHITHPHLRQQTKEQRSYSKHIAWNIFPESHFYTFLAGGLNIHGCHHENPRWTRLELMQQASATEYMTIDTLEGFVTLVYLQ